MDARDFIDNISLQYCNVKSLIEILVNSIIELDRNTFKSRDRHKIVKSLSQLDVILEAIILKNKQIEKDLDGLWKIVVKLEK